MSHYAVGILTRVEPDDEMLEQALAPFSEHIRVPRYIKKTKEEIVKEEKEHIEQYRNGRYAEFLKNPEEYKKKCSSASHINYIENVFPKKLEMTDEEIYEDYIKYYPRLVTKEEYEGMTEEERKRLGPIKGNGEYEYGDEYVSEDSDATAVDKDGNLTSTYNPKSKWDWYSLGGRFGGAPLKDGTSSIMAKVSDIEFGDTPNDEYLKTHPEVEEEYEDLVTNGGLYKPEYYKDLFPTLDDYVTHVKQWQTYSLLMPDGAWLEPGEMGWFGMSDAAGEDFQYWDRDFPEIMRKHMDCWLTLVDCHI